MAFPFSCNNFGASNAYTLLLVSGISAYLIFVSLPNHYPDSKFFWLAGPTEPQAPTDLNHVLFGLLGSEKAWHHRKHYIESWWRPNATRGLLYLDRAPTGELVPWSDASPPYRVSEDLMEFLNETGARAPIMIRMVHGIMELMREMDDGTKNLRWVVMGDDDSIFFVENMVDVLGSLDHRKYYYLGGQSEFVMSNYWYSFNQGFGGAGFILSYPLAKALAYDMEGCLRRHSQLTSADMITMVCIADIGVNLSPLKGIHQIDLHGDISGFLSSHPKSPLLSLHHFDAVEPIFPNMDRHESTRHLMKAAAADQSRMLQQTICHHRQSNWTLSISWGYSVHIYKGIMPRSLLQRPLETFQPWVNSPLPRPLYMFNTRLPSKDTCHAPHVFFFKEVKKVTTRIITTYSRATPRRLPPWPRRLPPCSTTDSISEIRVLSSKTKRKESDRCECCDVIAIGGTYAELKFRECMINEVIA